MKKIYLLLIPAALLFSCGNEKTKDNKDTPPARDLFRESVQTLKRNGFLKQYNEKQVDSLTEIYRSDSLNGLKNLMVQSGELLSIGIGLNNRTPHEVYKSISDTIGLEYPDLKAQEFKHEYLPETPGDKDTGWVIVRQRFGNSWYSRKLYYFQDWPVDNFVYRMYNTMLADSGKDTRLYLVEFFCTNCRDTGAYDDFMGNLDITRMGLLRLTKAQADTLLTIPQLGLDPEDEFQVYPTKKVEEEIAKFEATGLISDKDKKWYAAAKNDIFLNSVYSHEDILDFVDTLFCTLMFDTLNDYNPYEEIIYSMASVSRGNFEPDGLSDERVAMSHTRTVRFNFKGKIYEQDLTSQGAVSSPGVMDMVNSALEEQKAGGAFYTVLTRNDVVLAVYIEDKQVDNVMKSGFFKSVEKGASQQLKMLYGNDKI